MSLNTILTCLMHLHRKFHFNFQLNKIIIKHHLIKQDLLESLQNQEVEISLAKVWLSSSTERKRTANVVFEGFEVGKCLEHPLNWKRLIRPVNQKKHDRRWDSKDELQCIVNMGAMKCISVKLSIQTQSPSSPSRSTSYCRTVDNSALQVAFSCFQTVTELLSFHSSLAGTGWGINLWLANIFMWAWKTHTASLSTCTTSTLTCGCSAVSWATADAKCSVEYFAFSSPVLLSINQTGGH